MPCLAELHNYDKKHFQLRSATRGARNPNLRVVITHASHVCSQHSFGLHQEPIISCIVLTILSRETYAKHSVGAKAF